MDTVDKLVKAGVMQKILAFVLLGVIIFSLSGMFDMLLMTFIISYIAYSIESLVYKQLSKVIKVNRKVITTVLYLIGVGVLSLLIAKYAPLLTEQLILIGQQISEFDVTSFTSGLDPRIVDVVKTVDMQAYLKEGSTHLLEMVADIGKFSFHLFMAMMLSLFFMLERNEIKHFGKKLENSKLAGIYSYYVYFFKNFLNSFGKVLQIQILIAFINAVISTICLYFMGFGQVLGLGFMIFVFGLVPVAGVLVSLIPLSIIAFKIGGIVKILWVLAMIAVVHALESYVLNPKLYSIHTKLPIFFTFMTLLVSEHIFGIWGLLIGIPLVMFIMQIIGIQEHKEEVGAKK